MLKSEIDHLKELLSEKDLGGNVMRDEDSLEMEVNNLRRELAESRQEYEGRARQY